jgi:hypothetical protein
VEFPILTCVVRVFQPVNFVCVRGCESFFGLSYPTGIVDIPRLERTKQKRWGKTIEETTMHNGSRIILWIYLCLNWLFPERKKTSRGKVEETPCFYIKEIPKMFLLFFSFKILKKKNIQQLKEKRTGTREGSSALCSFTPSRLHPKSEWRWEQQRRWVLYQSFPRDKDYKRHTKETL